MNKEIKNIFNQSYQQHDSDVDAAAIWKALEQKKNKRRGIIWWFWGSSLVVLALLSYFILGTDNKSTESVSEIKQEQQIESTNKKPANKDNTKSINVSNNQKNLKETQNIQNNTQENIVEENKDQNSKNIERNRSNLPSVTNLEIGKSIATVKKQSESKSEYAKKQIVEEKTALENKIINETVLDHQPINTASSNINTTSTPGSSEIINRVEQLTKSLLFLENSKELINCFLSLSPIEKLDASNDLIDEKEEKEKMMDQGIFRLAILSTIGKFDDKFSGSDTEYLSLRSETETPLESFGVELNLSYQLNHFTIETGLNYLRSNRVMEWAGMYFGDMDGRFLYDYNPNKIEGDLLVETQNPSANIFLYDRNVRKYNETHTVSVPIRLAYSHTIKSMEFGIYAGAAFHLLQRHHADVIDYDYTIIDQRNSQIKLRPDLMGGISLGYHVNENISVISRFEFRHRLMEESILMKRTNFYTLGLGLQYHM